MSDVLRELDRGPSALPRGTHVTLFNSHEGEAIMADMQHWPGGPPRNIRLHHIRGNPLHRSQLEQVHPVLLESACTIEWNLPAN